ncbi:hypothetical protein BDQ94DRAFT_154433 [Aspergillus welwitschiae]|uniref:Uncharacterized protein n=1 Tax=Aspergillus welwitschiae TaxID=1341132 RepID=A0A3F3PKB8_9EURO|nr:hypothetical protein BDQ94DRAFT_154433 [Aspergillus welwitschiae]RDH27152.1 hypothetical protein BDQ94DRAFT_154433 [Aspergillus welwitschiae]
MGMGVFSLRDGGFLFFFQSKYLSCFLFFLCLGGLFWVLVGSLLISAFCIVI